jgi:hypothetical protein
MMINTVERRKRMVPLFEVRKILGLSWPRMMQIVRSGELPVYSIVGKETLLSDIGEYGDGLRVKEEDLDDFINNRLVS